MAGAGVNQGELKKTLNALKKLPENIQKNVVRGSVRAAANVVKSEMKSRVPYEYGTLESAIIVKSKRSRDKNEVRASATIKKIVTDNGKGLKNTQQIAYYLEYGTSKMSAQPFIRPSMYGVGNQPVEAARRYFTPALEKQKKKLGFK